MKQPVSLDSSCCTTSSELICHALPLHLALSLRPLPPYSLISLMVQAYPDAVTKKEETWGYYPLHLACRRSTTKRGGSRDTTDEYEEASRRNNNIAIVNYLISVFPEAAREKECFRGMLPVHIAAEGGGCQRMLSLLINIFPESLHVEDDYGDRPVDLVRRTRRGIEGIEIEDFLKALMLQKEINDCENSFDGSVDRSGWEVMKRTRADDTNKAEFQLSSIVPLEIIEEHVDSKRNIAKKEINDNVAPIGYTALVDTDSSRALRHRKKTTTTTKFSVFPRKRAILHDYWSGFKIFSPLTTTPRCKRCKRKTADASSVQQTCLIKNCLM